MQSSHSPSSAQRLELIRAALRQEPLDLKLRNVQIVNVYSGNVEAGCIGIMNGRIASLNAEEFEARAQIDGQGQYALPGLIDTHVHVDSTLLTPEALAGLIVPHGTTTLFADPMEIANVAGMEGIQALFQRMQHLPYRIRLEVPSRVPTAPGLETTGGKLGLEDVRRLLENPETISLGEMDPSKIFGLMAEYLDKIVAARKLNKIANGHAAGLSREALAAYTCAGLADDHECVDFADAAERLRLGLAVLIREGSTERNLEPIMQGLLREKASTRQFMFCTDDKHPNDIVKEGHIDYMVNRSIALGLAPVEAIQIASLNAVQHFRCEEDFGSLAPGRSADLLLTESLEKILPTQVYFQGRLVADGGHLIAQAEPPDYPAWLIDTVHIRRGSEPDDFRLPAGGAKAHVRVIEISGEQIVNGSGEAWLQIQEGNVFPDISQDVLKMAVVERYGKNGNIGLAFVRGFGLKRGALASSVSHDHHNIVVVGTNEVDMACCVREIERLHGGFVAAAEGEVVNSLALPVGGLISLLPATAVIQALDQLTSAAHGMGCELPAPLMTLSFISLPTVPELGLTDLGLVDVSKHVLISPFL